MIKWRYHKCYSMHHTSKFYLSIRSLYHSWYATKLRQNYFALARCNIHSSIPTYCKHKHTHTLFTETDKAAYSYRAEQFCANRENILGPRGDDTPEEQHQGAEEGLEVVVLVDVALIIQLDVSKHLWRTFFMLLMGLNWQFYQHFTPTKRHQRGFALGLKYFPKTTLNNQNLMNTLNPDSNPS